MSFGNADLNVSLRVFGASPHKNSTVLFPLRYAVSVAAFNNAGAGPFSMPLFQDTREGARMDIECISLSFTLIDLGIELHLVPAFDSGPGTVPNSNTGHVIGFKERFHSQTRTPEEGPNSVECGAVTSSALRVSWQPIPPHKQAGR
ncbi:hypothetical protein EVAR_82202_1 [Eumeta japonica]|uniref:Uncharacterized protein n=1 Tax=Eumeta variegata TaxID=151549 RepID=A0A4C1W7Q3_EUMVA|nr:hypothetical protein EVAR_82202_1 [Eumeta japonica]